MKLKYITISLVAAVALSSCTEWQVPAEAVVVNQEKKTEVLLESAVMVAAYKAIQKKPALLAKFNNLASTLGLLNTDHAITKDDLQGLCLEAADGNTDVMLALNVVLNAYEQYAGKEPVISLEKYDAVIRGTVEGISQAVQLYQYNQGK